MKKPRSFRAVENENGCLIWQHATIGGGYPLIRSLGDRKGILFHREVYELHVGPIPEGHHVHHTCGETRCINPEHLRLLTPSEHKRLHNGWDAGRCQRGHDITNPANLMAHADGAQCRLCRNEMQQRRRARLRATAT